MDNTMGIDDRKKEGFLGQKMVIIPRDIRKKMKKNSLTNSLYLTDIGYYPHAKYHYRKRPNGANEFILIYCLEGRGWVRIDSDTNHLKPNSYLIIPAHTTHIYGAEENDPWSIYWIHFTGSSAAIFYQKFLDYNSAAKNQSLAGTQLPFEERRINHFDGIISLLEKGYSMKIMEYINTNLWNLLSSFVYHDFYSAAHHQVVGDNFVNAAIKYMQEHLDQSISVEEIANHLNYSKSYLYSFFKEQTGNSPIQYFNHLKIQKACQYLSFTNLSIKEISYKLGFNDPLYFSRLFKKLMGLTPSAYRKSHKN